MKISITIENIIEYIEQLPDIYTESHGIKLTFNPKDESTKIGSTIRFQYKAIGKWLRYYLLGESDLIELLQQCPLAYYKPLAEQCRSFYNLAQEVILLNGFHEDIDANLILFMIIQDWCESILKNCGLMGLPRLIGKHEIYKAAINNHNLLQNIQNIKHLNQSIPSNKRPPMAGSLIAAAICLADIKENIRFRSRYRDFFRQQNRFTRELRNSPLQIEYLNVGGEIELMAKGKGKKGTKKKFNQL